MLNSSVTNINSRINGIMFSMTPPVEKQVPGKTSVLVTLPSLSNPGYRAIWGWIRPSSYCDYIAINMGVITLGNGTASIAPVYLGNWSDSAKTAYIHFEVMWIKN